jgi:hypothetical protein
VRRWEISGSYSPRARVAAVAAGSRAAWAQGSPRAAFAVAAALVCGVVAAVAFALAALGLGYALVEVVTRLGRGDTGGAARWATMTFAAGAPYIVGYAAFAGLRGCLGRLGPEAAARPRTRARSRPVPLIAVVALVSVGLQGVLAAGSYFTGDDWIHIVLAHDAAHGSGVLGAGPPSLDYLGRVVFIHYAPGLRLGFWALAELAPLQWAAALGAMLVLFAGSIFLLYRICRRLFGERRSNLVLVLLFGTSILFVTSFLWFSDGMHKFPSTFLSLVAVDAYLTHKLKGSRAALLLSVAAVSLASLFYVKALLVPLYLVMIRVLFLEERPRRALRVLWAERVTWLAFVPTIAIYLLNYLANYGHTRGPRPSLDLLGDYLWIAWFKGVTPALAGVEIGPNAASSGVLFAAFMQALLIAGVGWTIYRKRSAWRAWAFWGVAFTANAALVGFGRLGTMGLEKVGQQLRYDTEMSWLLPLALGFAFLPSDVAARPGAPPAPAAGRPLTARRFARVGAVLALCAYLVAATLTGAAISESWREKNSGLAEAYVENVRGDTARLARGPRQPVAIDDQSPNFLIGPSARPWNRLERLIPAIEPRLRVVVADPRPLQVGDDGHIGPAVLQPLASGHTGLSGSGTVRLVGGTARRVGGRPCIVAGPEPAALRFASKRELVGQSLYALVTYDVGRTSARPGMFQPTPAGSGGRVALDAPHGEELVNLGRPLALALPSRTRVCMHRLAVGWLGANGR